MTTTPAEKEAFKKAFRTAAEASATKNTPSLDIGGKTYTPLDMADEIEQETSIGQMFTNLNVELAKMMKQPISVMIRDLRL